MAIVDVRYWDDLTPEQRVALMTEIEEALIAQAKSDIPANEVDIRPALPTADVTMGAGVVANTWFQTPAGGYANTPLVAWTLGAQQNAALVMFADPNGNLARITVSNATTTLAIIETWYARSYQTDGGDVGAVNIQRIGAKGFFRQVFLFKKTETMTIQVAGANVLSEFPMLILLAEPAGTTVGCKA